MTTKKELPLECRHEKSCLLQTMLIRYLLFGVTKPSKHFNKLKNKLNGFIVDKWHYYSCFEFVSCDKF